MNQEKQARVRMELTYFDVVALIDDLREENANLTAVCGKDVSRSVK